MKLQKFVLFFCLLFSKNFHHARLCEFKSNLRPYAFSLLVKRKSLEENRKFFFYHYFCKRNIAVFLIRWNHYPNDRRGTILRTLRRRVCTSRMSQKRKHRANDATFWIMYALEICNFASFPTGNIPFSAQRIQDISAHHHGKTVENEKRCVCVCVFFVLSLCSSSFLSSPSSFLLSPTCNSRFDISL